MKKKSNVIYIALIFIVGGLFFSSNAFKDYQTSVESSKFLEENVNIVLDASQFWESKHETISEINFIKLMGEPDSTEEWIYETTLGSYQIKSLYYDNYEYMFNGGTLTRISIEEGISYNNKDEILKIFGLKEYSNSEITDTNHSYRVTNCGVVDFWVQDMDENNLITIKISYSSFW
jgi:hypothetical protein